MTKTLIGLAIAAADIWAIIQVFNSKSTMAVKLLWTLLILFFPVIGLIIWYFAGPGKK
jgi:hypothetical protein